jgi:mycothiol synthase
MHQDSQPGDFVIRPAGWANFKAVWRLVEQCNREDYEAGMVSEEYLRHTWEADGFDLAQDTWLACTAEKDPAGYLELEQEEPGVFFLLLYIDPAHRESDLGARLLRLAEQRARAKAAGGTPIRLGSRVSQRDLAGRRTFEAAGYSIKYSFLIMERVMETAPEPPEWPERIRVKEFSPGQDEQVTYQTDEAASEDKGYHQPLSFAGWAKRMGLNSPTFDPGLWFLAWDGAELAGVALNVIAAGAGTGWVDHLGVRREWRKQGLGMALLLHSLGAFYRRGVRRVRLSVDSHSLTQAPKLYERAGMKTIQEYHIYRLVLA